MAANKSSAMSAVKRAVAKATGRGQTPATGSAAKPTSASTTATKKTTTAKKTAQKKSAQKKSAASAPAKKSATKKTATKKTAAKQPATAKAASAKKTPAKTTPAKKTTAKKATPAKKSAAKSASGTKQAPTKKSPAKKSPAKKAAVATSSATTTTTNPKQAAVKKATTPSKAGGLAAREGEKNWSAAELKEVRATLEQDRARLITEIAATEEEISHLLREGGEGAGNDQADVGSNTFERDHEMSMAKNSRENLELVEGAIARIDKGTYGVCESCGGPIGKMRLQAFPRATLCLECKQRQERR